MAEVRNQVNAIKPGTMKDIKILGTNKTSASEVGSKTTGSTPDLRRKSED